MKTKVQYYTKYEQTIMSKHQSLKVCRIKSKKQLSNPVKVSKFITETILPSNIDNK